MNYPEVGLWSCWYDDVIKWKYFPRYWPFVRGIHRSPVNSRTKASEGRALTFCFIWAWTNGWVNNPKAGDLRRHRDHYYVAVMNSTDFHYSDGTKWLPHTLCTVVFFYTKHCVSHKMCYRWHCKKHVIERKYGYLDSNISELCCLMCNWQSRAIGSGNVLTPSREQAII